MNTIIFTLARFKQTNTSILKINIPQFLKKKNNKSNTCTLILNTTFDSIPSLPTAQSPNPRFDHHPRPENPIHRIRPGGQSSLSLFSPPPRANLWIRPLWKRSAFIRKPSLFAASRYQWTNRWNLTVIYRSDPTTAVLGHGNYARKIPSLPIENWRSGEESLSSLDTLAKSTAAGHYNGSAGLYFNVIANFQRSIGSLAWQIATRQWLAGIEWFIAWSKWNRAFGR